MQRYFSKTYNQRSLIGEKRFTLDNFTRNNNKKYNSWVVIHIIKYERNTFYMITSVRLTTIETVNSIV